MIFFLQEQIWWIWQQVQEVQTRSAFRVSVADLAFCLTSNLIREATKKSYFSGPATKRGGGSKGLAFKSFY